MRPLYAGDANPLIAASGVVALHHQTIAAANDYWKTKCNGHASDNHWRFGLANVGNRMLLAVDAVKQSSCKLLVFHPVQ